MSDLDAVDAGAVAADAPAGSIGSLIFPQFNYTPPAANPLVRRARTSLQSGLLGGRKSNAGHLAPQVPFCPQGRFDCLNVRTSDNQILTACALLTSWSAGAEAGLLPSTHACAHRRLWVSAAVGLTWLLIFGIFRDKIAVYRTRLVS